MKIAGILRTFILLIAISAVSVWFYFMPRIESLEPIAFSPGESIVLTGENFGKQRGKSYIEVDGSALSSSAYKQWSKNQIEVSIPFSVDSGLIRIIKGLRKSNPRVIIASRKVPSLPASLENSVASPLIRSVLPAEAKIGGLLTIEGINFGSNFQFGRVRFPRNSANLGLKGQSALSVSSDTPAANFIDVSEADGLFEHWDDKKITLRVPEGAGSGVIVIETPQGESKPFDVIVGQGTGTKYLYDPAVYSIQFNTEISIKSMKDDGVILVYAPNPVATASQAIDSIQEELPFPYFSDYGPTTIFRFLKQEGSTTAMRRTFLLTVYGIETELARYSDSFDDAQIPDFLKAFTTETAYSISNSKDIPALSGKIVGREKNLYKKASLIWTWLKKNIAWHRMPRGDESSNILLAIKEGRAETRQYVLLATALFRSAGIPAVPLSGFIIKSDTIAIPHSWLEFYLPAVGWIPFDPVLGLGEKPSGFDSGFTDPTQYFGSLDNRHIAISRGMPVVQPILDNSERRVSGVPWSMQSLFEESLEADYKSTWEMIRVLGVY
jgi:hypothetical protein